MQTRLHNSFISSPLATIRPLSSTFTAPSGVATSSSIIEVKVSTSRSEATDSLAKTNSDNNIFSAGPTQVTAPSGPRKSPAVGSSSRDANKRSISRLTLIDGRSDTSSKNSTVADGPRPKPTGPSQSPATTTSGADPAQSLVSQVSITQGTIKGADALRADAQPTHSTATTPTKSAVAGKVASLETNATWIIDSAPAPSHNFAVGVQLFQGDVNYLSTPPSRTGTVINARNAQVPSSDALVRAPKVANRSQAGSGNSNLEVSAPTRFVSTPSTATVIRPTGAADRNGADWLASSRLINFRLSFSNQFDRTAEQHLRSDTRGNIE